MIENFEKIFISFMNDNYQKCTEKDIQRLIQDDLRRNIQAKLQELQAGNYTNCDPYKISRMLENTQNIKRTNTLIVEQVRKGIATLIN